MRSKCSRQGNSINVGKRGTTNIRSNSVNNFCETQEGEKQILTHNKFEGTEPAYAIHRLQDGRHDKCYRPSEYRELHGKDRSKGSVLAYSNPPIFSKVSKIQMENKTVRNLRDSFWGRTRSTDIHKTYESSNDIVEKTDDNGHISLFGRFADNRENRRGNRGYRQGIR